MAKGNWKPSVIQPKARCRLCGFVVKGAEFVRLNGVNPAHKSCADKRGLVYTVGLQIRPTPHETDAAIAPEKPE